MPLWIHRAYRRWHEKYMKQCKKLGIEHDESFEEFMSQILGNVLKQGCRRHL